MREIYLDNAATTKPLECVIEAVSETMRLEYGNPSSLHKKGIEAENKIKESTDRLTSPFHPYTSILFLSFPATPPAQSFSVPVIQFFLLCSDPFNIL